MDKKVKGVVGVCVATGVVLVGVWGPVDTGPGPTEISLTVSPLTIIVKVAIKFDCTVANSRETSAPHAQKTRQSVVLLTGMSNSDVGGSSVLSPSRMVLEDGGSGQNAGSDLVGINRVLRWKPAADPCEAGVASPSLGGSAPI